MKFERIKKIFDYYQDPRLSMQSHVLLRTESFVKGRSLYFAAHLFCDPTPPIKGTIVDLITIVILKD